MGAVRIGLVGEMRSGKDTVASLLAEELQGEALLCTFSGGIHTVIKEYMPELYSEGKPRLALQKIGQLFREFEPDVWIECLFKSESFTDAFETERSIIVTDVRQPNEVARLQDEGFTIIKVAADQDTRIKRIKESGDNFDTSMLYHETEILARGANYDVLIENSGSLEDLATAVRTQLAIIVDQSGGGCHD